MEIRIMLLRMLLLILLCDLTKGAAEWKMMLDGFFGHVKLIRLNPDQALLVGIVLNGENWRTEEKLHACVIDSESWTEMDAEADIEGIQSVMDAVLTEFGELAVLGMRHASARDRRLVPFVAKFNSYNLQGQAEWIRSYEGIGNSFKSRLVKSVKRDGTMTFVFVASDQMRLAIVEVDSQTGDRVCCNGVPYEWANTMYYDNYIVGDTTREDVLVAFSSRISGNYVYLLGQNRSVKSNITLGLAMIECVLETNGGIIVVTKPLMDYYNTQVFMLDRNLRLLWKQNITTMGVSDMILNFAKIIETAEGNYVLVGSATKRTNLLIGVLVGLHQNGTVWWTKTRSEFSQRIIDVIELKPREYVFTWDSSELYYASKYTLPEHIDTFPYLDLDSYKICAMGFYWNLANCLACPPVCASCISASLCTRCARGYSPRNNDTEHICIPIRRANLTVQVCNCSVASGDLSPVCRTNCSLRHREEHCRFESNSTVCSARGCVCPDQSVNNGTHCILTTTYACPPLCAICTEQSSGGESYFCIECEKRLRVVTHQTGKLFVDCRCEFGYTYNGSACESLAEQARKRREHPGTSSTSAFVLAGGILGATAIALGIVWVLCWRRGRPSRARVPSVDLSRSPANTTKTGTEMTEIKAK